MGNIQGGSSHNLVKVCLPEDQKIMPLVITKEEKCYNRLREYFRDGDGVLQPTSVIWETVKKKRGIASLRKELSEQRKRIFGGNYENEVDKDRKKKLEEVNERKMKKESEIEAKKPNSIPLFLPGLMKPIDVPIDSLNEDLKKKIDSTKGDSAADKLSHGKFVIKKGKQGLYLEPEDPKIEQNAADKTKENLFKEMEEKFEEKYRLRKKKSKTTMPRFKEKSSDNATTTKKEETPNTTDELDDDEASGLKKLVLDLTSQVKSLKIQNEHMMDDDYKHKKKNKKRAKTINKIGALKLLLTNLKSEMKDDDSESDVSSIKNQLDRLESK